MNILYFTAQPDVPRLEKVAADAGGLMKVVCPSPDMDLFIANGVVVVEDWRQEIEWAEVAVVDNLGMAGLYRALAACLPVFGIGDQMDKLPLRQGDVWYRLGVPSWRLCPNPTKLAWALYNDESIRRYGVPTYMGKGRGRFHKDDWVLNPLWDYLRHCKFVGPAGVRVARHRFSKLVVDIDFAGAYNAWLDSEPHPAQVIKELVCP